MSNDKTRWPDSPRLGDEHRTPAPPEPRRKSVEQIAWTWAAAGLAFIVTGAVTAVPSFSAYTESRAADAYSDPSTGALVGIMVAIVFVILGCLTATVGAVAQGLQIARHPEA